MEMMPKINAAAEFWWYLGLGTGKSVKGNVNNDGHDLTAQKCSQITAFIVRWYTI